MFSCNESASSKIKPDNLNKTQYQASYAEITFDRIFHDFGAIKEGEIVKTVFSFTNTGENDLYIVDAIGSCGCTVPKYPKNTAIKPGQSETITVSFDSSNKPGMQQKSVTLSANTSSGREMLRIKANVTPDPIKQKQRDDAAKARQQNSN